FSTKNPNVPIFCSNPPLAPAARWRRGVPESSPATLSVPTISVCGRLARVINISVLALEGGAIIPSQIASPLSILAATVPSMASTGVSSSSKSHSRKTFSVSSISVLAGCGPEGCALEKCVPGDCGGGGGGGAGGETGMGCGCGCGG